MIKEFKEFLFKGNIVDLAVAVVLGGAFALVVNSFVNDILMNVIAAIFGEPDFSSLTFDLGDGVIAYGAFLNTVINLVIVGFALFMVLKAYNRARKQAEEAPAGPTEIELLTEIRDSLRK